MSFNFYGLYGEFFSASETCSSTEKRVFWDRSGKKGRLTPPFIFLWIFLMVSTEISDKDSSTHTDTNTTLTHFKYFLCNKKAAIFSPASILQLTKGTSWTTAKHCPASSELFPFWVRMASPQSSRGTGASAHLPDRPPWTLAFWNWRAFKKSHGVGQNPWEIVRLAPRMALGQLCNCKIAYDQDSDRYSRKQETDPAGA